MNKEEFPKTRTGHRAWFPKKRFGYGWGLPITWQGWIVFLGYLVLSVIGAIFLSEPPERLPFFLLFIIPLTVIFIYICWKKGEKQES
ncbi:MAG: hypothetical protein MI892_04400 [Desulfobacterales bacterium]|nr:hypothetical protein [Desulfobacterales bacterium]